MKKNYKAELIDGRPIYIPSWPATVQFENLTQVVKYLGQEKVINISSLNIQAAMLAVMGSDDHEGCTSLMMHFIRHARLDGNKLDQDTIEKMEMSELIEIFTHVMHSQYDSFFVSGLAKVSSQP